MLTDNHFKIDIEGFLLTVTAHIVNNDEVFRIVFSDERPPLVVFEALSAKPFWTSIPQGRQQEAAFFGAKIADYLKNK
jgi:hypothetical protein